MGHSHESHEPANDAREAELAAAPLDAEDAAVLGALRAAVDERDPVPDGLVERVQFELTLDALHAEVATLTQGELSSARVRSVATEAMRTVTFTSHSLTTMVTLAPQRGDTVRIDGWAAPGAGATVELLTDTGRDLTIADEHGRFAFADVPTGPVKFVLSVPQGDRIITVVSPLINV